MPDNIATLGLAFDSKKSLTEIKAVVDGFVDICNKCRDAQREIQDLGNLKGALDPLINELNKIPKVTNLSNLALEINKFKGLKNLPNQALNGFFGALQGLPSINKNDVDAIGNLGTGLKNFKFINAKSVLAIRYFFAELKKVKALPPDVVKSIGDFGNAVSGFKAIRKNTIDSLDRLFKLLPTAKPIPASTLNSIRDLKDLINAMNLNLGKTSGASKSASDGLGRLAIEANGVTKVMQALTQAISVSVLAEATRSFQELGIQLAYIKSIALDIDIEKVKIGLENISPVLGKTAKNAEALYYAYSSGVRGTEESLVEFTEIAAKTALLTRSETRPMVDAMTAAMNAYGISASNASIVSNNLFKIIKFGKASGEQLANSFGQVSPTARTLGVSLEELGASIASLTKVQPTRVAITSLNNMLSKMMKPTKESAKAMRDLGIDMSFSAIHSKGFAKVMQEVHDKLNGNIEALKNIFPDLRGQRAAMYLLGQGWNDFSQQIRNFSSDTDAIGEAFEQFINNANVQLSMIPETIEKIKQKMGEMTTQIITLGGALTPVIRSFNEMGDSTKKWIAVISEGIAVIYAYKGIMLTLHTLQALNIKTNKTLTESGVGQFGMISGLIGGTSALWREGKKLNAVQLSNAKELAKFATLQRYAAEGALMNATAAKDYNGVLAASKHLMAATKTEMSALNNVKKVSITTTGLLGNAIGFLRISLIKLKATLASIFSFTNVVVVGTIAMFLLLFDHIQAFIRNTEPLHYKLVTWLYDIFTGVDKVKEKAQEAGKENKLFRFNEERREFIKMNDEIKKSFGHIFDDLFKEERKLTIPQYFSELNKSYKEAIQNSKDYQKDLDDEVENFRELAKARELADFNGDTDKVEQLEKDIQASKERIQSLQNQADEYRGKIAEVGDSLRKFYRQWQDNFDSIKESFSATEFELLLSNEEKIVETQKRFNAGLTDISEALNMADPEELSKKTKAFLDNFKTLHKEYTKIIEDEEKTIGDVVRIQKDFEKSFLKTDSDVFAQAQKDYKETWNRLADEVNQALSDGATYDLDLLKNSLTSLASEANKMLEINKRLGEAERRARFQTVELVKSMNKLTSTSVDAVDALSSEASVFNNRVMLNMRVPDVQPIARDNGEKKFRDDMKMATDAIQAVLDKDIQNQRINLESLKTKFAEGQTKIQDAIKDGNKYLKSIQDNLGNINVVQFN